MYLNQFQTTDSTRLQQILSTLDHVHGVKINIDLANHHAVATLKETQLSYQILRDSIVNGSGFNSYQQNPEYIKSLLILEAVKIMLTEIAPKRRRSKKMNESTMDRNMKAKPTISTQLSDIALSVPQTSDEATAFSNTLSSIADKMAAKGTAFAGTDSALDSDEKAVMGWIKSLPRPIHVNNMISQGVKRWGPILLKKRMDTVSSLPKIDMSEDRRLSPQQLNKISALGRAMIDYSTKTHSKDERELAILNSISRVGDKLASMGTDFGPKGLTDTEKKIVKLAQMRMKTHGDLTQDLDEELEIMTAETTRRANPGMDNIHESDTVIGQVSNRPKLPSDATFSQAHHYEYQASMARSELYRNAKYAMSMMKQVDPNGEVPPWIAACLTKSANMLDKIFHYLDYYKTFEPDQLPEGMDSDMELGETSGSIARENLMLIIEYSTNLFNMIKPGDKLEGWVAMKLTTASECISSSKHYMDYVQFEQHAMDDHFEEGRKAKRRTMAESRLYEEEDPDNETLARAQLILNAKSLSSKVQDMAEDVAKMSVNDLMPLVDSMRAQFGPEAATGFNTTVKTALDGLLENTTSTKEAIDTAVTTLQGGGVPAQPTDIEQATPEPAAEEPVAEEPPAEEPAAADQVGQEALGRAKKPMSEGMMKNLKRAASGWPSLGVPKIGGTGGKPKDVVARVKQMSDDQLQSLADRNDVAAGSPADLQIKAARQELRRRKTTQNEAWGTEMHTAKKDIGKWDDWTIAELKARKKQLMHKPERNEKEQKEVRQLNFAIRAKQKDHWGDVNENAMTCNECGMGTYMEDDRGKMCCNECGAVMIAETWPGYKKKMADQKKIMSRTDKEWNRITKINSEPPVVEAMFGKKITVTQEPGPLGGPAVPPNKAKDKAATTVQQVDIRGNPIEPSKISKKSTKPEVTQIDPKDMAKMLKEKAPPGEKAEQFIRDQKDVFKKRYGKNWESVLYATAWKEFGPKHEGYISAVKALAEAKGSLAGLKKQMNTHRVNFKKHLAEGTASDPLQVGYGLEGEDILQQMKQQQRRISELTSVVRHIMQEGVIGMLQNIKSLNKAKELQSIKNRTPYGVVYETQSGSKSKKMFETADTRAYWLDLHALEIKNPRMIDPETFDRAIDKKTKA